MNMYRNNQTDSVPYESKLFALFKFKESLNSRTQNFRTGFTLIELLVVISIIGLMSSTVLAIVNTARMKADNASRVQTMRQYINALNLLIDDRGRIPKPAPGNHGNYFCIGHDSSEPCLWLFDNGTSDNVLNDEFRVYLPSLPRLKFIEYSGGYPGMHGPIYLCGIPEPSNLAYGGPGWATVRCSDATIASFLWGMEGENQSCLPGYIVFSWGEGVTMCYPSLENFYQ